MVEWHSPDRRQITFLAFAPDPESGLRVYQRVDFRSSHPFRWEERGTLATALGKVDAISGAVDVAGGILLVIQVGNRLFELERLAGDMPEEPQLHWKPPVPIAASDGRQVEVAGPPSLLVTDSISSGQFRVAVPIVDGALLLGKYPASTSWTVTRLPVNRRPDSIALIDKVEPLERTYLVGYRVDRKLFLIRGRESGAWEQPFPLRCRHSPREAPFAT